LNFTLAYDGSPIDYDGTVFYVNDQPLSDTQKEELLKFATTIAETPIDAASNAYPSQAFSSFSIFFRSQPIVFNEGKLFLTGADQQLAALTYDQRMHLRMFARNLKDERGDFIMTGTYGDDFTLLYKGEALKYENRRLIKSNGQELSKVEYALLHKSRNTASSFIYILTGLHLLHFIGGILYLILISIKGFRRKFDKNNYLGIKLSGVYWHFLGILWIYLFIFLSFIH
jgi:cytochrome c oxidase subunit 3